MQCRLVNILHQYYIIEIRNCNGKIIIHIVPACNISWQCIIALFTAQLFMCLHYYSKNHGAWKHILCYMYIHV